MLEYLDFDKPQKRDEVLAEVFSKFGENKSLSYKELKDHVERYMKALWALNIRG